MRPLAAPAVLLLALTFARAADDPRPNDATLGAKPPEGAIVLFEGEKLDGWVKPDKSPAGWPVHGPVFAVGRGQGNILTEKTFGDHKLHLEFSCPYEPNDKGQARGNSGVYVGGVYEVQILDSYGLPPQKNECAAVYNQIAPKVNACKPPLQWQTYDITYHKAKVEDGKVVKKARITVVQNGVTVIDDQEMTATPGGISMEEGRDGPLLLQDHGDDVQFRNIWVVPLTDEK